MPGGLTCRPLSPEQASSIRRRQRFVNKATLYAVGAVTLTFALESLYRNLGGSPEISNYIFQAGSYTLLGTGLVALFNNQDSVVGPESSEGKENRVEQ